MSEVLKDCAACAVTLSLTLTLISGVVALVFSGIHPAWLILLVPAMLFGCALCLAGFSWFLNRSEPYK